MKKESTKNASVTIVDGYLRLPGVLAVVPVSRSTWLSWVKSGKAPKPIKLSERTTVWKVADIRAFVNAQTV